MLRKKAKAATIEYGMLREVKKVLVAYSGGADSSALLHWLCENAAELGVAVAAVHVHHGIRGEEADSDAAFCARECERLGVPFRVIYRDVPALAREWGCGIEEAGRRARYAALEEEADRAGADRIATAHHANDNLETVIFNLARGTGSRGLCGIAPVRGRVIRPFINCTREDIERYIAENKIEFVTDSTNADDEYRRNFIRRNIVPGLVSINSRAVENASETSRRLRSDEEFLLSEAKELLLRAGKSEGWLDCGVVSAGHRAVAVRAIALAAAEFTRASVNLEEAYRAVCKGKNTRISVGGGLRLTVYRDSFALSFDDRRKKPQNDGGSSAERAIVPDGPPGIIFKGKKCVFKTDDIKIVQKADNIYKKFIHRSIDSAIIKGKVYVRAREAGDKMTVRGHAHTVKNLFQEAGIPENERRDLPIFCDDSGILWIPGVALRDKAAGGGTILCAADI